LSTQQQEARVEEAREPASYRRLFAVPGFPQLSAGIVLARTAGTLFQVALVLFVLQQFHSPVLAGIASFLSIAPGLVVSPIAGALLDRQGRVRLILLDYAVAGLALLLLFGLSATGQLSPATLLPIVALSSLTGPLSASGVRTLFPLVAPRELWDRANAVDSGSQALAMVLGPALAGFLVAWLGGGVFLATAALFGLAALVLVGIRVPETAHATDVALLRSAWQALVYVVRHATLRGIMFTLFASNIGFGILVVALPVLILSRFHWGADAVGELWSAAGLATVASGFLVGRFSSEGRERAMVAAGMILAALGTGVLLLAGLVSDGTMPLLLVGMLLIGVCTAPIDLGLFALRQRRTDPRWFGRAFAVSMSLNFAGQPIGSALGGLLVAQSVLLGLAISALVALASTWIPLLAIPET
jgi:MFS family permease